MRQKFYSPKGVTLSPYDFQKAIDNTYKNLKVHPCTLTQQFNFYKSILKKYFICPQTYKQGCSLQLFVIVKKKF